MLNVMLDVLGLISSRLDSFSYDNVEVQPTMNKVSLLSRVRTIGSRRSKRSRVTGLLN